jgi:hypothetical protein
MDTSKTALERAFELAQSGSYTKADDIRRQLTREGYSTAQMTGNTLLRQLRGVMKASQDAALHQSV